MRPHNFSFNLFLHFVITIAANEWNWPDEAISEKAANALPDTTITLSELVFSTDKTFIEYFQAHEFQISSLKLECDVASDKPFAEGKATTSKETPLSADSKSATMASNLDFSLPNPKTLYMISCSVSMETSKESVSDRVVLFTESAASFNETAESFDVSQSFSSHTDWRLSGRVTRRCAARGAGGFSCDRTCAPRHDADYCFECTEYAIKQCCPDVADTVICSYSQTIPTESPSDGSSTISSEINKENLFFWIMIGLGSLSVLLLIALIVLIVLFCCCKPKSTNPPKSQTSAVGRIAARTPHASRHSVGVVPIRLQTPPRDAKHGYHPAVPPPPPPHGDGAQHDVNNVTADTNWDSLADEWIEHTSRREAQV